MALQVQQQEPGGSSLVEVTDLSFAYGPRGFHLSVAEFRAAAGEKVALIGPSGSGKTTFLHLLAGIRAPTAGQVVACGQSLTQLSPAARRRLRLQRLGLVFQEFELLEYLSVLDNILIACRLGRALALTPERRRRAEQLAVDVGLGDKLRRLPQALSQGERQRVAVCRALLNQPEVLLADEPTGSLDPANKDRILDLLVDYAGRHRATLIAATHDYQLLDHFDRVVDVQPWARGVAVPSVEAGS